jgi:CheY-like chemotaxis protein
MSRFRSVLLVDDSEDDNFIHKSYICRINWADEVVEFEEALLALDYLLGCKQLPDVMLLDINMPVMDGFQLLDQAIAAGVDLSKVIVVMVSSSMHPDDRKRATGHAQVNAYVNKPVDEEILRGLESL